jgi:hypothetical protein
MPENKQPYNIRINVDVGWGHIPKCDEFKGLKDSEVFDKIDRAMGIVKKLINPIHPFYVSENRRLCNAFDQNTLPLKKVILNMAYCQNCERALRFQKAYDEHRETDIHSELVTYLEGNTLEMPMPRGPIMIGIDNKHTLYVND